MARLSPALLAVIAAATACSLNFSAPLAGSDFSGTTTTVMVEVASTGVPFSGTIWFDDFRIQ